MRFFLLLCCTVSSTVWAGDLQVDLHLDTPTQLLNRNLDLTDSGLEAGQSQLNAGGTNIAVMVLWPPRQADHRARTFQLLSVMEAQVAKNEDVVLVRTAAEAREVAGSGKLALVLSLEGAHGLGEPGGAWSSTLDELHARGLRLLGLTWSMSNQFAGSSGDNGGGLTAVGEELVMRAGQLGIMLDLSHASRETTLTVCSASPVPVIASHSNAHALRSHARNLTDEEIRCIAKTGGVIGLNFHANFVGPGANVSKVANHADHIAEVGGHQAVALGSDFDGYITTPEGLMDASQITLLWDELRARGWSEQEIAGVRGENFLRAWGQIQAR